ncbi:MAG: HD domain-containing protein, partial [Desulfobacula sp.]|uniref:HD domain-containing protein n=1 Tax=Desulfobacula sp. TaxID=2593537 RepID=UPI0025BFFA06
ALFHDIGRFKQYLTYATFNDTKSINHAKLGIQQLSLHKILNGLSTNEKRFIVIPIVWHNAYKPPDIKDDKMLLFIKLLRDADKLDIWKVVVDYYKKHKNQTSKIMIQDLPDNGQAYSARIIKSIHEGKMARITDLSCLTDLKLLQISWVYDLNFTESYRLLQQSCYIEELVRTLPKTNQIKNAVKVAIKHIEKMAGHV